MGNEEPDYGRSLKSTPLSGAILAILFLGCGLVSLLFAWALALDGSVSGRLGAALFAFMGAMLLRAAGGGLLIALGKSEVRLVSRPMALLFLGALGVGMLALAGDSWMKHRAGEAVEELSMAAGFLLLFVQTWRYLGR